MLIPVRSITRAMASYITGVNLMADGWPAEPFSRMAIKKQPKGNRSWILD